MSENTQKPSDFMERFPRNDGNFQFNIMNMIVSLDNLESITSNIWICRDINLFFTSNSQTSILNKPSKMFGFFLLAVGIFCYCNKNMLFKFCKKTVSRKIMFWKFCCQETERICDFADRRNCPSMGNDDPSLGGWFSMTDHHRGSLYHSNPNNAAIIRESPSRSTMFLHLFELCW